METERNIKLRNAIFLKGVSQRDLAFQTRIAESRVSKVIRGYETPTQEMKEKICHFLGVSEKEVF